MVRVSMDIKATRLVLKHGDVIRGFDRRRRRFWRPGGARVPERVRTDVRDRQLDAEAAAGSTAWTVRDGERSSLAGRRGGRRVERLRAAAAEAGLDAFVATSDESIAYLTGFRPLQLERLFAVVVRADGGGGVIVPKLDAGQVAERPRSARARLVRRLLGRPARAREPARRRAQGRRRGGPPRLRPLACARRAAGSSSSPAGARDLRPAGAQGRGRDRGRSAAPARSSRRRSPSRWRALRPGIVGARAERPRRGVPARAGRDRRRIR